MSSNEEAPPFHGAFTKDVLYELHRQQPHRFNFMTKFNAKSASWKDFELVVLDGELRDFARCVHCKNFVSYSSKKGTGSMLRHRCHAKESYFTAEEHNRFREMELFLRTTPQPLALGFHGVTGMSPPFLPRVKVEVTEPPDSPLRSPDVGCGGGTGGSVNHKDSDSLQNNINEDGPLDVRINNTRSLQREAPAATDPVADNGEVEEIVASVELADDSTGDGQEERRPMGRAPNFSSARGVVERQLVELQRLHAEEEHKLKVDLLRKQHAVADLQRKYWRMKVKILSQKVCLADHKGFIEDDSDSAG